MSALESTIVKSIERTLKARGAWWFKTHGAGLTRNGIPDLVGAYRSFPIAFEVKRPDGRPTRLQVHELERAQAAGVVAAVVRSVEEVEHHLDTIDRVADMQVTPTSAPAPAGDA